MEFVRRPGFRLKSSPQLVGEVCHSLEEELKRKLMPMDLVDASRDENAPLHDEFEWNDGVAAEKWRERQAGYIIQSVAVRITEVPTEVTRMNVKITEKKGTSVRFYHSVDGKGYESLENIIQDEEKRKKLLENCVRDINVFQEKYELLRSDLSELFDAMDEVVKKVG